VTSTDCRGDRSLALFRPPQDHPIRDWVRPWARTIEITFVSTAGLDRVRNFAEELSLKLDDLGELPMEEADSATNMVTVSKIAKRDLGRCRLVVQLLAKHMMTAKANLR
jgi:hypothetical protein